MPRQVDPEDQLIRTITVRLSHRDLSRLAELTARLPMPPMAVAREIIRLGLDRLEAEGPGFLLRPADRKPLSLPVRDRGEEEVNRG